MKLLDALGLCMIHLGHREAVDEFTHGTCCFQVCFTLIRMIDIHDDGCLQGKDDKDEDQCSQKFEVSSDAEAVEGHGVLLLLARLNPGLLIVVEFCQGILDEVRTFIIPSFTLPDNFVKSFVIIFEAFSQFILAVRFKFGLLPKENIPLIGQVAWLRPTAATSQEAAEVRKQAD